LRTALPAFPPQDTEFPGVVARPVGAFSSHTDYHYQMLRCNVDLLRLIQLGLTLCDERGALPEGCPTWQFNFTFSLQADLYAADSVDLLSRAGIDFARHARDGVDVETFAEALMASGLVLSPRVQWLSFHSSYDFGYLLKLLTASPLPSDEASFFSSLRLYFPRLYDVKQLLVAVASLKGGLSRVAEDLRVPRIGAEHQAGSDSLLTALVFFRLRDAVFEGRVDDARCQGVLYGLAGGALPAGGAPPGPPPMAGGGGAASASASVSVPGGSHGHGDGGGGGGGAVAAGGGPAGVLSALLGLHPSGGGLGLV
jgi:CCR4-NOT transcription complex subunit 7/8